MLLNYQAEEAQDKLQRKGPTAACLWQHVDTLFKGNTEEGTKLKIGDSVLFCDILYSGQVPEISIFAGHHNVKTGRFSC